MSLFDTKNYQLPIQKPTTCRFFSDFTHPDPDKMSWNSITQNTSSVTSGGNPIRHDSPTGEAARFIGTNAIDSFVLESEVETALADKHYTASIMFRVNTTDLVTDRDIYYAGGRDGTYVGMYHKLHIINGKLAFSYTNDSSEDNTEVTDVFLTQYEWFMCHITVDDTNSELKLYVNGELVLTVDASPRGNILADRLVWGGAFYSNSLVASFIGDIDFYTLHEEVFTASDVQNDFLRVTNALHPTYCVSKVIIKGETDLSNVYGYDMLQSVSIDIDSESGVRKGSVKCLRDMGKVSLAPLVSDTPLAIPDYNDPDTKLQYLDAEMDIEILVARCPIGTVPSEENFQSMLLGRVSTIKWGSGSNEVTFDCTDNAGRLVQSFISTIRQYEDTATDPQTHEPVSAIEDLVVLERIIHDNSYLSEIGGDPNYIIERPYPSEWLVQSYEQKQEKVFTAMKAVAANLGWSIDYMWHPIDKCWKFKYYQPERDRTTSHMILRPYDIIDSSSLETSSNDVRNVVRVSFNDYGYNDSSAYVTSQREILGAVPSGYTRSMELFGTDSEDNPLPSYIEYIHNDSIVKYGRKYMQMNEYAAKGIERVEEASNLALAALSELQYPYVTASLDSRALHEINPNHIIYKTPNRKLHTAPLKLAIDSVSHKYETGGKSSTSFTLKGKAGWSHRKWLEFEAVAGQSPTPLSNPNAGTLARSNRDMLPILTGSLVRGQPTSSNDFELPNRFFDKRAMGDSFAPDNWNTCKFLLSYRSSLLESSIDAHYAKGLNDLSDGFQYIEEDTTARNSSVLIPFQDDDDFYYGLATDILPLPNRRYIPTDIGTGTPIEKWEQFQIKIKQMITGGISAGSVQLSASVIVYDKDKKFLRFISRELMDTGFTVETDTQGFLEGRTSNKLLAPYDCTVEEVFIDEARYMRFIIWNESATDTLRVTEASYRQKKARHIKQRGWSEVLADYKVQTTVGSSTTYSHIGYSILGNNTDSWPLVDAQGGGIIREDSGHVSTALKNTTYIDRDGYFKLSLNLGFKDADSNTAMRIMITVNGDPVTKGYYEADNFTTLVSGSLTRLIAGSVSTEIKLFKHDVVEFKYQFDNMPVAHLTYYGLSQASVEEL